MGSSRSGSGGADPNWSQVAPALAIGLAYLLWRTTTLGSGSTLPFSALVLALEVWAYCELTLLAAQAWTLAEPWPRGPMMSKQRPVDIAILAGEASPEELEKTLIATRAVRSRGRLVVIDDRRRFRHRSVSRSAGAFYVVDELAATEPGVVVHRHTQSRRYVWIEAGQLPMPDLVEAVEPRFARPGMAVCQVATSLLNAADLAHLNRGDDDAALINQSIGPALSRWDAGPWTGSASVVNREAIEAIGGFEPGTSPARMAARLHQHGWATSFEPRRLVAAVATEAFDRFLAQRRQHAADAFTLVASSDGPFGRGRMTRGQRLAHLGAAARFASSIRLLAVALVAAVVLVTGVVPFDGPLIVLVVAWATSFGSSVLARRVLARGAIRQGQWLRQSWRVLDADLAALLSVCRAGLKDRLLQVASLVSGRASDQASDRSSEKRQPRQEPTAGLTGGRVGLGALAHLPVLDTVVVALDLALLVRALTLIDGDLLPPMSFGIRLVVIGGTLALLAPVFDVLQVLVLRRQRRAHYRVSAALEATFDGTSAATVDVTPSGAGLILPFAPDVGLTTSLELALPGVDGVVRRVVAQAMVRSVRPNEAETEWRVGVEIVQVAAPARQALVSFCASQALAAEEPTANAVEVATAPGVRAPALRRVTAGAAMAGLATMIFGPGVASASGGDPAAVEVICVQNAQGEPRAEVAIDRLVDTDAQALGVTDESGCATIAIDSATTGFAVTDRGQRYELVAADYHATTATVAQVERGVQVVDLDGLPVVDIEVRYFTDRWLTAESRGLDQPGSYGFEGFSGPISLDLRAGSVRYVVVSDADETLVQLSRVTIEPGSGLASIDRGSGWETVDGSIDVLPGHLLVRVEGSEVDGEVDTLRIDLPAGHELLVPSGELRPVELELDNSPNEESDPEIETEPVDGTTSSTSEPGSSEPPTTGQSTIESTEPTTSESSPAGDSATSDPATSVPATSTPASSEPPATTLADPSTPPADDEPDQVTSEPDQTTSQPESGDP